MKKTFNKHINSAEDLVTTYDQTRTGFLNIALEKNKVGDPFVKQAFAFKETVKGTERASDFLEMPQVKAFLLTAAGLSDKSQQILNDDDKTEAIRELIHNYLDPAGNSFIDEAIYRFLLIKGDAVGGTMRNRIGALGQERFIRMVISCLLNRGMQFSWLNNEAVPAWNPGIDGEVDIEKMMKALYWSNAKGNRVLAFNLTIPVVTKNIDICLFDCTPDLYHFGAIVRNPEHTIMLGELKGGFDPAGADEHWKTANTALDRIRRSYRGHGLETPFTSFIGAAIEKAMAGEIYAQLVNGTLSNAANLLNGPQLTELCHWILEL